MGIENSKSSEIVAGSVARKTGFVEGMSAGGVCRVQIGATVGVM